MAQLLQADLHMFCCSEELLSEHHDADRSEKPSGLHSGQILGRPAGCLFSPCGQSSQARVRVSQSMTLQIYGVQFTAAQFKSQSSAS